MPRTLSANRPPITNIGTTVPINKGGTNKTIEEEVLPALNAIDSDLLNQPGYPVKLTGSGKLPIECYPDSVVNYTILKGPTHVGLGLKVTYTIGNYNINDNYSVSVSNGIVGLMGNGTILFIAPSIAGPVTLTVNERTVTIVVCEQKPAKPVCSAYDLGEGSDVKIVLEANSFTMAHGIGTHFATDWQVATDSNFNNLVYDVVADPVDLLTATASNLAYNTIYYCRTRRKDNKGIYSEWSNPVVVKTNISSYSFTREQAKILSSDYAASDQFGASIALSYNGDIAVVASSNKTLTYNNQGRVYVFRRYGSSWWQVQVLTAPDPATNPEYFGYSVSISHDGTYIAISAYANVTYTGAVYIYDNTGSSWVYRQKLTATDKVTNDYFGYSLCMSGDGTRLVVGAYNKNGTFTVQGAAYVFARSGVTWSEEQKLTHSDPASSDKFGHSVAINTTGDLILVSAVNKIGTVNAQGAVYAFTRSVVTWTQSQKIVHSNPVANDALGQSITISGDSSRFAVGGLSTISSYTLSGSVFIFYKSGATWIQEQRIDNPTPASSNEFFSYSISMNYYGTMFCTSAYGKTTNTGIVYYYKRTGTTWSLDTSSMASTPATSVAYGKSVSMSPNGLYVGIGANLDTSSRGSAYIYVK